MEPPGPPPAYETVVEGPPEHKDCILQVRAFHFIISAWCQPLLGIRPALSSVNILYPVRLLSYAHCEGLPFFLE